MSATTEALQQTTHQSHLPSSQLLHHRFTELCRHYRHRPLPDQDRPWIHLAHHRRLRHRGICPWTHMVETTTLTATMSRANHHHRFPAPFRSLHHQSLPEKPSSPRMIALMTCTLLLRPGGRWIVPRHRHQPSPSSKRQCLRCPRCHLPRSQAFRHVHHPDNLLTCNGHLSADVLWIRADPLATMDKLLVTST